MAGEREFVDMNVKRALLREYLQEQTKRAGFGGADIQRTPMGTRVTLVTERPGLVIGRKGSSIKALTDAIEFDFGFDKPQVEVVEVENPNLSAQIMAEKLASALERGWHFRRAGHSTVRRIMENGAKGCQVIISGKLTGQRHRTEKFKEGHIKFCGEPKLQFMEEGYTPAKLKAGVIGVKVQIMHPDARLPDEVNIIDESAAAKIPDAERPEEKVPAKKKAEEKVEEPAPEKPKEEKKTAEKPKEAQKPQKEPAKEESKTEDNKAEDPAAKPEGDEAKAAAKKADPIVESKKPEPENKEGADDGTAKDE